MRKIILSVQLILLYLSSLAQSREIIGRVLDASTNKPVSNASVIKFGTIDGTVTNQLGFFSLPIKADNKSLVISCIGYLTSKLDIPEEGQFKVLLAKDFRELIELDLGKFEYRTLPQPIDSIAQVAPEGAFEKDAEYPGGWEYFYNDLGFLLKTDSVYNNILLDSIRLVRFTVEKDGKTTDVNGSPHSVFVAQSLKDAFAKLKRWRPALQNKVATAQHFELPIKWTRQLKDSIEEVFAIVEEPAHPKNDMAGFYSYLESNIRYPALARRQGVGGQVFVEFLIEKDGRISNVRVMKGIGADCDTEAVRVVSSSPDWIPGKQRDNLIKQRMVLPIIFYLGDSDNDLPSTKLNYEPRSDEYVLKPVLVIARGIERDRKTSFSSPAPRPVFSSFEDLLSKDPKSTLISASGQKLKEIPTLINQFHDLMIVDFGSNEIEMVPKELTEVASLQEVYLPENRITTLPDSFRNLKSLKILGLAQNAINDFPVVITHLENLTALDLSSNQITVIPRDINKLKNLKFLFLQNNKITSLPIELQELTGLKSLYLSGNSLQELEKKVLKKALKKTEIHFK